MLMMMMALRAGGYVAAASPERALMTLAAPMRAATQIEKSMF